MKIKTTKLDKIDKKWLEEYKKNERQINALIPLAKEYLIRCKELDSPFFMEKDKFTTPPTLYKKEYRRRVEL